MQKGSRLVEIYLNILEVIHNQKINLHIMKRKMILSTSCRATETSLWSVGELCCHCYHSLGADICSRDGGVAWSWWDVRLLLLQALIVIMLTLGSSDWRAVIMTGCWDDAWWWWCSLLASQHGWSMSCSEKIHLNNISDIFQDDQIVFIVAALSALCVWDGEGVAVITLSCLVHTQQQLSNHLCLMWASSSSCIGQDVVIGGSMSGEVGSIRCGV